MSDAPFLVASTSDASKRLIRLERLISAISYVATECRTEIDQHCANIQPGGGRIAQCLELAKDELGAGCTQAMTDVGLLK